MLTRRQWLQINPRPKSPVNLQALLDQENINASEQQNLLTANQLQNATQAASLIAEIARIKSRQVATNQHIAHLTAEIAKAAKCPLHQSGLHYHRNRAEDLFICENGPHFLFWTQKDGKPALIPVNPLQALPGLDFPMTEGFKLSRAEWLATHPARFEERLKPTTDRPLDVFISGNDEKFLWTLTESGPGFLEITGENPPALEAPIE